MEAPTSYSRLMKTETRNSKLQNGNWKIEDLGGREWRVKTEMAVGSWKMAGGARNAERTRNVLCFLPDQGSRYSSYSRLPQARKSKMEIGKSKGGWSKGEIGNP